VTSDEPWSDVWHTQLHYTFQLSGENKVYFLQPPTGWRFSNLFRFTFRRQTRESSITLVQYINYLPAVLGLVSVYINDKLNQLRFIFNLSAKEKKNLLIWHFDPMRSCYFFSGKKEIKHIYHVVDPYAGTMLDAKLASSADLVVVTSPKFLNHYRELNVNVLHVRQGADISFFQSGLDQYRERKSTDERVLLIGTLSNELDLDLLGMLAEKHGYKFLFIGPDKFTSAEIRNRFTQLVSKGSFTWLGQMAPAAFLPYLVAGKAGVIAYDHHNRPVNNLRSPLKVITYLAAGKPVITNIDCEIPELLGKGIYFAGDHKTFIDLLGKVYRNELPFDTAAVSAYLESVSYKKLIADILAALPAGKVSHA
jgi:glycosyltransferase involved in cell wall biosynthesis